MGPSSRVEKLVTAKLILHNFYYLQMYEVGIHLCITINYCPHEVFNCEILWVDKLAIGMWSLGRVACNEYWPLSYDSYNKDQHCMAIHNKPAQPLSCTKHIILITLLDNDLIHDTILFMLLLLFCDTRFCKVTLFILVLFINWVFDFEIFFWGGGTACQISNANESYQGFDFLLLSFCTRLQLF